MEQRRKHKRRSAGEPAPPLWDQIAAPQGQDSARLLCFRLRGCVGPLPYTLENPSGPSMVSKLPGTCPTRPARPVRSGYLSFLRGNRTPQAGYGAAADRGLSLRRPRSLDTARPLSMRSAVGSPCAPASLYRHGCGKACVPHDAPQRTRCRLSSPEIQKRTGVRP